MFLQQRICQRRCIFALANPGKAMAKPVPGAKICYVHVMRSVFRVEVFPTDANIGYVHVMWCVQCSELECSPHQSGMLAKHNLSFKTETAVLLKTLPFLFFQQTDRGASDRLSFPFPSKH